MKGIHANEMLIALDEFSLSLQKGNERISTLKRLEFNYKLKNKDIQNNRYGWITVLRGSKMNAEKINL